ncbi:YigZ family protein [Thalassotalea profundi]|uniref:YigZ family protein n=1 Tax=Thalassotalea profundi TaxID=2036687 RepID=A0ABQ3J1D7_9GAMM|nr:YigZ family protein [Thalassotalea profundi]GHE96368.1 YigZ family protein [Thalassotalea profundi]
MSLPYLVAAEPVEDETIVNRSRFICYLSPCQSNEMAKEFIKQIQQLHPQANHHCYAFVSSHPLDSQSYGFSDDGEPSGTAGKPMLIALQGSNIGEICAVVVRYFGGTKLGTGGLQRAYGGSVRQALRLLTTKTKIPMVHKTLACQYTHINDVIHVLEKSGGNIISEDYQIDIHLEIALPETMLDKFTAQIQTLSAGQIELQNP